MGPARSLCAKLLCSIVDIRSQQMVYILWFESLSVYYYRPNLLLIDDGDRPDDWRLIDDKGDQPDDWRLTMVTDLMIGD